MWINLQKSHKNFRKKLASKREKLTILTLLIYDTETGFNLLMSKKPMKCDKKDKKNHRNKIYYTRLNDCI